MQMLNWLTRFNICSFLDNHEYSSQYANIECIAAAGTVSSTPTTSLDHLQAFIDQHHGKWIFGHIAYDCKNQIEDISSLHPDPIGFPDLFFFVPAVVVKLSNNSVSITCYEEQEPAQIFEEIIHTPVTPVAHSQATVSVQPRLSREQYIGTINKLKEHIQRGDCYEINFCQEFFATGVVTNPPALYNKLTNISPTPFACYYQHNEQYLLCASPERYLQKKGDQLLSQPIKGTIQRLPDPVADQQQIATLQHSEKDKSENVMVVDLVRNDLSRVCKEGSVKVAELFGIYSFPQVHQMISTIEGKLDPQYGFTDIIKATFPMGSMTGAPKKRVMQLIEQYEHSKRGLYSGAVGYIDPAGNFDLNVVIRSIFYNAATNYLGYQVGGAITFYSNAAEEYEECLVKAAAIRKVLADT